MTPRLRQDHLELLLYLHEKVKGHGVSDDWSSAQTIADFGWEKDHYHHAESYLIEVGLVKRGGGSHMRDLRACLTGEGRNLVYAIEDEAKENGLTKTIPALSWTSFKILATDVRAGIVGAAVAAVAKYYGLG